MNDLVSFLYVNHRGETAVRRVRPIRIFFGSSAFHPESQWLMEAFDFALSGILGEWRRLEKKP